MDMREKISSIVTQIGAAMSIVGGLTLTEWGVVIGITLSIAGFAASQYWQYKNYRVNLARLRKKHQDEVDSCNADQQQG